MQYGVISASGFSLWRTLAGLPLVLVFVLLAGCGGSSTDQAAEDYPNQDISYIIPFDPGGESDLTARIQQDPLEEALGTSVVISQEPGAGGALAWSRLSNIQPDGYTIMGFNTPHIVVQPLAREDAGYETDDITPVYIFQVTPNILFVPEDSPIDSLEDFVEEADANPGDISVAGTGEFTTNHIATLQLQDSTGIELSYVPFTGTGATVPAFLGGQVDALFSFATVLPQLEGEGKAIAVASEERLPQLPDVPTFEEEGYDIAEGAYRGVTVPPGTPDEIINTLAEAFEEVNTDPEVIEQQEELGVIILNMGPQEANQFISEQREEYKELLADLDPPEEE